mmetsp:Transcript_57512/g.95556  ORF Transcript_57512/g.95556 Transcript_57512/m.95556 type:complete len:282 (-) Transcript_57512:166-1011(-)
MDPHRAHLLVTNSEQLDSPESDSSTSAHDTVHAEEEQQSVSEDPLGEALIWRFGVRRALCYPCQGVQVPPPIAEFIVCLIQGDVVTHTEGNLHLVSAGLTNNGLVSATYRDNESVMYICPPSAAAAVVDTDSGDATSYSYQLKSIRLVSYCNCTPVSAHVIDLGTSDQDWETSKGKAEVFVRKGLHTGPRNESELIDDINLELKFGHRYAFYWLEGSGGRVQFISVRKHWKKEAQKCKFCLPWGHGLSDKMDIRDYRVKFYEIVFEAVLKHTTSVKNAIAQ